MPDRIEPWVLDTHIWIRLLNGDALLNAPPFLQGIQDRSAPPGLYIADITLWETAMLTAKNRLSLSLPLRDWLDKALAMPGLSVIPITPEIAADSCSLPGGFHGDPADRLIIASARWYDAVLISLDRAILDYGAEGWVKSHGPV
jgi:PIN domain nuclease of toxin-antitoxin system